MNEGHIKSINNNVIFVLMKVISSTSSRHFSLISIYLICLVSFSVILSFYLRRCHIYSLLFYLFHFILFFFLRKQLRQLFSPFCHYLRVGATNSVIFISRLTRRFNTWMTLSLSALICAQSRTHVRI